jgi:uncharacterized protein (DUF433 family)
MATAMSVDIGTLISKSPKVREGRPVIAGTGMTVRGIVGMHLDGVTVEEIARRKYLTLAQVHAALAYYYANQKEIEDDIAAYEAEYARLEKEWQDKQAKKRT